MAELPNGFDANQVEPSQEFDNLPAGKYVAEITDSDMRSTSRGDGQFLWLEFTVLDGAYASRKIWTQLNLINPSAQAVEIAQRQLSSICHAVGKLKVSDSLSLHSIPMELTVKIKNDKEYGPSNEIRAFKSINRHQPSNPFEDAEQKAANPKPTNAVGNGNPVPPWKRK